MAIWRLQCRFQMDSTLPADALIITPHFNPSIGSGDADSLAEDLATALQTWATPACEIGVKAYDAQGTPPVYPQGDAIRDQGLAPASSSTRESAICLSFYATQNRPRQRGRLYVPVALLTSTSQGARPTTTQQQKVADLVPIFAGLGGPDIDWVVFSRLDNTARKVTNWWVDNAWDTQRSRGLKPTSRLEGTTGG